MARQLPAEDPSFVDETALDDVEKYVARYGEEYRAVIKEALYDAVRLPWFNGATFNFDRYLAAVIFNRQFIAGSSRGPCCRL